MKIAFLTPSNVAGGAERVMISLANYLSLDNDVSLILLDSDSSFYKIEERVSCYRLGIGAEGKKALQKYIMFPKYCRRLKRTLNAIKPDVVISFLYITNVIGIACCRSLKIPIVISERNDPTEYPHKRQFAMKKIYPMANGLVCQSSTVQAYYKAEYNMTNSMVIENPLNETQVGPFNLNKNHTIISVGRLIPQKNFSMLIRAFSEIHKKYADYKLVIYGEGPLRNELEELVSRLNIQEHVFLPGVEKDAIIKHNDARLFVLSSNFEGYPNVLVEAMASGIMCIASDVRSGTVRQVIKDGVNGFIFPVGDTVVLKKKMIKALSDDISSLSMAKNATEIYRSTSIEEISKKWVSYLMEITS